jgi:hypothetical protein
MPSPAKGPATERYGAESHGARMLYGQRSGRPARLPPEATR